MQVSHRLALALAAVIVSGGIVVQSLADDGAQPSAAEQQDHRGHFSPRQFCVESYAHKAGHLAYLEARLGLTPDQQALWDKWRQASTDGAEKQRSACLAGLPKPDAPVTALDRESLAETMLSLKVDSLKAARPALEALYAALSPEQRAVFDRQGADHRRHWHGRDAEWGGDRTL